MNARVLPAVVAALCDASLPVDEFVARTQAPLTEDEVAATLELVTWFTRRYPTVRERLDYVRRAHARWSRPLGGPAAAPVDPSSR